MFNETLVILWNWLLQAVVLLEDSKFVGVQLLPGEEQVSFRNVEQHRPVFTFERHGMYPNYSFEPRNATFEEFTEVLNNTHYQRVSKISSWLSEVLTPVTNWVIKMLQGPNIDDSLTLSDPWKLPEVYKKLMAEQPDLVRKMMANPQLTMTTKRHIPPVYDYVPADVLFSLSQENGSQIDDMGYINFWVGPNYTANVLPVPFYLEDNSTNDTSSAEQLAAPEYYFVSYIYEVENQYEKFLLYKEEEEIATHSRLIYFNTEITERKNQDRFQRRSGPIYFPDGETPQKWVSKVCGRPLLSRRFRRLVNGRTSADGQWPWMGYVAESTNLLSKSWLTYHGCGGVLISTKFVVTASHCWKHMRNDEFHTRLHVQFGTTEFYDPNDKNHIDRYEVLRMYTHSEFDSISYKNDITLLELKNRVTFTYNVLPVCLPSPGQDFVGEMAIVIGWGQLHYESAELSRVQQYVDVPIISRDTCQRWFDITPENVTVLPEHICAGYVDGGKDACKGDSGGPLVVRDQNNKWVLAGTVSYGFGCAEPFRPGLYANVTHFLPWIYNIVNRSSDSYSQE